MSFSTKDSVLEEQICEESSEFRLLKYRPTLSSTTHPRVWPFPRSLYVAFGLFVLPLVIILTLIIVTSIIIESSIEGKTCYNTEEVYKFDFSVREERVTVPVFDRYLTPKSQEDYDIRLDGHTHTKFSDGWMSPKQLLEWAIASDYNAIIVTDHNTWIGAQETMKLSESNYADKIVVIPGLEFSCCRIHMNIINISDINGFSNSLSGCEIPKACGKPSDEDLQNLIRKTHEFGGKIVMNHWPWSHKTEGGRRAGIRTLQNHPTLEQLLAWGVDGFEIINGRDFDFPTLTKLANFSNVTFVTGSDIHVPFSAYSWTLIQTPSRSRNDIMNVLFSSLSKEKVAFQYLPEGTLYPNPSATITFTFWKLWMDFGSFIKYQLFMNINQGLYSFSKNPAFCHDAVVNIYYSNIIWFLYIIVIWLVTSFILFYFLFLRKYLI